MLWTYLLHLAEGVAFLLLCLAVFLYAVVGLALVVTAREFIRDARRERAINRLDSIPTMGKARRDD